jgi:hypothetical protein
MKPAHSSSPSRTLWFPHRLTHSDGGTVITNTGFSTRHEDRALLRWISACAVGAIMVAMIGFLTVTSGAAVRYDLAAAGTAAGAAIDHAVGRASTKRLSRRRSERRPRQCPPKPNRQASRIRRVPTGDVGGDILRQVHDSSPDLVVRFEASRCVPANLSTVCRRPTAPGGNPQDGQDRTLAAPVAMSAS